MAAAAKGGPLQKGRLIPNMNKKGIWPARSRVLAFSVLVAMAVGALATNQLLVSRSAIWNRALSENANLLFVVASVLEGKLRGMDIALRHTVDRLHDGTLTERLPRERPPREREGAGGPALTGLVDDGQGLQLVLDHTGTIMWSSRPIAQGDMAFSDNDYFLAHEKDPDSGLLVSALFNAGSGDQASIALSRRWTKPDGGFGGVVVQTLRLSHLHELFSAIELGPNSGINLFLLDGTIIARFPYTGEFAGTSLAGTPNFDRFARERQGTFTGVAAIDKVERLYTFRTLDGFPLLVNTAQSTAGILAGWRSDAIWLGTTTAVLILACFGLAMLNERELRAHRRTIRRLHRAEHEMRTVLDSLPAMVAYWDNRLINRFCNRAHQQWFGLSPEEAFGKHISSVIGQSLFLQVKPHIDRTLSGCTQVFQKPIIDMGGAVRHTVSTYVPDINDGKVDGFFVLVHDVTARKLAEDALYEEKERFRVTLESIADGVITTDEQGRITYENRAADMMTGWPLDKALGLPIEDVVVTEDPSRGPAQGGGLVRAALAQRAVVESDAAFMLVSRSGQRTPIEGSAAPIFDEHGRLAGAVMVFHDVSHARSLANEMARLAQYDALTGVPSRNFIRQLAEQAMNRALRGEHKLAVMYLDLDGFKAVNDSLGHAVGDQLLVAVTRRLADVLRKSDTLGRKGGDEFVVLMDGIRGEAEANILASRLVEACRQPVELEGQELSVTVSIGISIFPDHAVKYDELVNQADVAMYFAKQTGRNRVCVFQPDMLKSS